MMNPRRSTSVDDQFIKLEDLSSLDDFVARLNGSPGVLFKHSNTCGVSSRAYDEMAKLTCPIGLVVVQRARQVSDEIEARWRISHESPQVLIVHDGRVVWTASHFQIKAPEVETALKQLSVD